MSVLTPDDLLDGYPEDIEAALDETADRRHALAAVNADLDFIVQDVTRWPKGDAVTVAFLGGSSDLHAAIADAAGQLNGVCGIHLDFGFDAQTGSYRRWSPADTSYRADIRVGFDMDGHWSLVGMASIDRDQTPRSLAGGGGAHQRSLNLGGFDRALPDDWRQTVLHEFLHALGVAPSSEHGRLSDDDRGLLEELYPTTAGDQRRVRRATAALAVLAGLDQTRAHRGTGGLVQVLNRVLLST